MVLYKVLSLLLDYPSQELMQHLGELRKLVPHLPATDEEKQILLEFLEQMQGCSLTEWQSEYVQTFDLNANHTLYLTHHLFDEQDRARGPTLVKLAEYFRDSGYELVVNELPDYLPVLLEYCSTFNDPLKARQLLHECQQAVAVIAENLEKIASPYAPLLRMVEHQGDIAALASLATQ